MRFGTALFVIPQATLLLVLSCKNKPNEQIVVGCMPATNDAAWYAANTKAPLIPGLQGVDFTISTANPTAQAYFNQGLMLAYGFNHAEAARSFYEASRLDSTCAMAYWGFAYVLGPNYNAGMEADNYERAYKAAQKAAALAHTGTAKEKALITALLKRYAPVAPANRAALDIAFSSAMKKVYQAFPTDPDIGALYAESLMDMHPWDLYDKKTKAPKPWTPEIVEVLEKLIDLHPNHPGAPHFYIHAVEASAHPEKGLNAANKLMTLVPASGHLVHMPSHIYIWTGDYHKGSLANLAAVQADSAYLSNCHAQGAYPLAYFPHNYHYLAATATFEGNGALAWEAAKKVQEKTAQDVMVQPDWATLQHYYTIPYFVAVKFKLWDSILVVPPLDHSLTYPRAILHYARGMAYLGKDSGAAAENELVQLNQLATYPELKSLTIWDINSTYDIVQIARYTLSAEINRHKRKYPQAIALYKKAIAIEDNLNYNEPPDWFFSVRHHLGAALLAAGNYKSAQHVYEEDLNTWRENGWALIGLQECLQRQGKFSEAQAVSVRCTKAWQHADRDIRTCL